MTDADPRAESASSASASSNGCVTIDAQRDVAIGGDVVGLIGMWISSRREVV